MDEFGPNFPERIFAQMRGEGRKGSGLDFQHGDMSKIKGLTPTEGDVFRLVTGEDLGEVMDLARARWHKGTEAQRHKGGEGARGAPWGKRKE